jgi:hypothetical protein
MIHPVLWQSPPNQVFTAERLREVATYCDVGTWSIAKIIAATTSKEVNTVHADMSQTTYFNAERSKAYGLVNTIVTELFPARSPPSRLSKRMALFATVLSQPLIRNLLRFLTCSLDSNCPFDCGS